MHRTQYLLIFSGLFFMLSTGNLISQDNFLPGYIVSGAGDTLGGSVEYLEWQVSPALIAFRRDPDDPPTTYLPGQISSFGFAGFIYRSRTVNISDMPRSDLNAAYSSIPVSTRQTVFLRLLVEGEVSLYQYTDIRDIDHFYLETQGNDPEELIYFKYRDTDNGRQVIRTNTKYIGQLIYYLQTCDGIRESIGHTDYTIDEMMKLIASYNRCTGRQVTYRADLEDPLSSHRKRSRLKFGLYAGVDLGKLAFKWSTGKPFLDDASFPASVHPSFGMMLLIEPARARGRWAILADLLFWSYSAQANTRFEYTDAWYRDYDVDLAGTYIVLNPQWRYYFGSPEKVRPYLNAGVYVASRIRNINTLTVNEDYYGNTSTWESTVTQSNPVDMGFSFGTGIFYKHFNIDIRYSFGVLNPYEERSSLQFLSCMLGYRFN